MKSATRDQLLREADDLVRRRADSFNRLLSPADSRTVADVCRDYLVLTSQLEVVFAQVRELQETKV